MKIPNGATDVLVYRHAGHWDLAFELNGMAELNCLDSSVMKCGMPLCPIERGVAGFLVYESTADNDESEQWFCSRGHLALHAAEFARIEAEFVQIEAAMNA